MVDFIKILPLKILAFRQKPEIHIRLSIFRKILPLCLLFIFIFQSCEKKEGKIYLRIINSINDSSQVVVKDSQKEIPLDGKYYEVSGYLETEYKLLNVVWDSVTNWTHYCILEQTWRTNRTVNRYFGDFEKLPEDSYYTLNLKYKIEYSEPVVYSWLDQYSYLASNVKATYYNITFKYLDNSSLSYSPAP
jgi:hypothetical protein